MRPTPLLQKLTNSSKGWLSTHLRDPYVKSRQAHPAQFRSRSAFKLIELDEKYGNFLQNVNSVVDLGAAPGGWSQVVAAKMGWAEERELDSVPVATGGWEYKKNILEPNFHHVIYCKPDASRKESAEGYWLCKGWKG
ncbi:hypothetical protein HWV62_20798 [Athelia sp. TMB]|nr:hypothetical protein HWV62_20798 [Athelia sp. TMB]